MSKEIPKRVKNPNISWMFRPAEGVSMKREDFSAIRHQLGKSQSQLAKLLCVSPKTIQSFEQGWRNVPPGAERQLLLLLWLKINPEKQVKPCWEIRDCPEKRRVNCPAWEFKAGHLCWFINGTSCNGKSQDNWKKKMVLCRKCEVLQPLNLPPTFD